MHYISAVNFIKWIFNSKTSSQWKCNITNENHFNNPLYIRVRYAVLLLRRNENEQSKCNIERFAWKIPLEKIYSQEFRHPISFAL